MRARICSVVVLALVAVACGDGAGDLARDAPPPERVVVEEPTTEPAPPASPHTSPSTPVPELLDFTAEAVEGGQVVGAEFAGQALAIWFWAPW